MKYVCRDGRHLRFVKASISWNVLCSLWVCFPSDVFVLCLCQFVFLSCCFHCLKYLNIDYIVFELFFGFQNVEDWETGTDRCPVYSYTRQQLRGETIRKYSSSLYELIEEFQTKMSLVVGDMDPENPKNVTYLKPKDSKSCNFSVIAVIPSNNTIPMWHICRSKKKWSARGSVLKTVLEVNWRMSAQLYLLNAVTLTHTVYVLMICVFD